MDSSWTKVIAFWGVCLSHKTASRAFPTAGSKVTCWEADRTWRRKTWAGLLILPLWCQLRRFLVGWFGKLQYLPLSPHQEKNSTSYQMRWLWEPNDIIQMKHFTQQLAHGKDWINVTWNCCYCSYHSPAQARDFPLGISCSHLWKEAVTLPTWALTELWASLYNARYTLGDHAS